MFFKNAIDLAAVWIKPGVGQIQHCTACLQIFSIRASQCLSALYGCVQQYCTSERSGTINRATWKIKFYKIVLRSLYHAER